MLRTGHANVQTDIKEAIVMKREIASCTSPPQSVLMLCAGHANVQTDIKEAIFMGSQDELVAAGSDDGSVFIYDAVTGQVVKVLQADEDVANCVQVSCLHPAFVLVTAAYASTYVAPLQTSRVNNISRDCSNETHPL